MKNSLLLFTLALGLTFTSCSKDDDTVPQTKTEMLTGKNWKVIAQTTSVNNGTPSDTYATEKACTKDDFETYASDGNVTFDEGPTKCAVNEPQTQSGTWAFVEDESKLKITRSNIPTEYTITELTASSMVLTTTQTFTQSGQTSTYTYVSKYGLQ